VYGSPANLAIVKKGKRTWAEQQANIWPVEPEAEEPEAEEPEASGFFDSSLPNVFTRHLMIPEPPRGISPDRYPVRYLDGTEVPPLPPPSTPRPPSPPQEARVPGHGSHSPSLKIDKAMTLGESNILTLKCLKN